LLGLTLRTFWRVWCRLSGILTAIELFYCGRLRASQPGWRNTFLCHHLHGFSGHILLCNWQMRLSVSNQGFKLIGLEVCVIRIIENLLDKGCVCPSVELRCFAVKNFLNGL